MIGTEPMDGLYRRGSKSLVSVRLPTRLALDAGLRPVFPRRERARAVPKEARARGQYTAVATVALHRPSKFVRPPVWYPFRETNPPQLLQSLVERRERRPTKRRLPPLLTPLTHAPESKHFSPRSSETVEKFEKKKSKNEITRKRKNSRKLSPSHFSVSRFLRAKML